MIFALKTINWSPWLLCFLIGTRDLERIFESCFVTIDYNKYGTFIYVNIDMFPVFVVPLGQMSV